MCRHVTTRYITTWECSHQTHVVRHRDIHACAESRVSRVLKRPQGTRVFPIYLHIHNEVYGFFFLSVINSKRNHLTAVSSRAMECTEWKNRRKRLQEQNQNLSSSNLTSVWKQGKKKNRRKTRFELFFYTNFWIKKFNLVSWKDRAIHLVKLLCLVTKYRKVCEIQSFKAHTFVLRTANW